MAHFWHPDDADGNLCGCILQVEDGQTRLIAARKLCPHHASMRLGKNNTQFFDELKSENRFNNQARMVARRP